jgi:RNA polymerase sigma factor (sigma-70 family)
MAQAPVPFDTAVCAVFRFDAHYCNKERITMAKDNELLLEYTRTASQVPFAELVQRHLNMVYSTALREARGDMPLAQELTQLVFIELSRKASSLVSHPALAGWLYTSVRRMAANARRSEERRQRRHFEYQSMSDLQSPDSPESTWEQVRPLLDDTLHELGETDRTAVVLRFFENLSLKEVGLQLGLSENAARMRVDRALTKLEELLSKRGVKSTSSALAGALVTGAVVCAPAGLAASIATKTVAVAAGVTPLAGAPSAKLLKAAVTAKKLMMLAAACVFFGVTIASIHFIRLHPGVLLQVHSWLLQLMR